MTQFCTNDGWWIWVWINFLLVGMTSCAHRLPYPLPSLDERVRWRREETKEKYAGGGTGGAWARGCGCGCAAVGDGGRAPRAGAASSGHRGAGEGRESGAGAVDHGAQDAVQRHGAPHPGAHPLPRQGLGEARARA
jgi:hypothetical protein